MFRIFFAVLLIAGIASAGEYVLDDPGMIQDQATTTRIVQILENRHMTTKQARLRVGLVKKYAAVDGSDPEDVAKKMALQRCFDTEECVRNRADKTSHYDPTAATEAIPK